MTVSKKELIDDAVNDFFREKVAKAEETEDIAEALEQVAKLPGKYYALLLENETPEQLAYDLVLQWHAIFWSHAVEQG